MVQIPRSDDLNKRNDVWLQKHYGHPKRCERIETIEKVAKFYNNHHFTMLICFWTLGMVVGIREFEATTYAQAVSLWMPTGVGHVGFTQ